MTTSIRSIDALLTSLDAHGVPRPPDVQRAIDVGNLLQTAMSAPPVMTGRVIDLGDEQIEKTLTEFAARMDPNPLSHAGSYLQGRTVIEALDSLRESIPAIFSALRKPFDQAAKEVAKATKAGIRPGMTSDDILDLDSREATAAWRGLDTHVKILNSIAAARIELSTTLGLPPSISNAQSAIGERVDYTACFTHPDSGIVSGWTPGAVNGINKWLSLSLATNGRLRLNLPEESERMIHGVGESPGWIVASGAAVVYDNDRRSLHLYTNEWVPSWVEDEQIESLVDHGMLVPARPGTRRPVDKQPLK